MEGQSDHLVWSAREIFPRIYNTVPLVTHSGGGLAQIQPTAEITGRAFSAHVQIEIAEGLIALLIPSEPMLGDVGIGLGIFPGSDQLRDMGEVFGYIKRAQISGRFAGSQG